jgi:hypothetical protein
MTATYSTLSEVAEESNQDLESASNFNSETDANECSLLLAKKDEPAWKPPRGFIWIEIGTFLWPENLKCRAF